MRDSDILVEIGKEVEKIRRIRKWTQKELAVKSSIGINTISRIEKCDSNVLLSSLLQIIKAFDMVPSEFFVVVENRIKRSDEGKEKQVSHLLLGI